MSRRDDLLELLRPPVHRGPVIASGAVLFTAGLLLEEQRLDDRLPNGVHLVLVAAATALLLGVALLSPLEGGRPTASQSVLLVCGLVLLEVALLELAHILGAPYPTSAAALTWTSLVLAAVASYPARRRNAAIATMITAVALGVAVLAAADWLAGPLSATAFRWLLLALSLACVLASLVLRGGSPRHAELLVVTAGLATLAIPVAAAAGALLPLLPFGGGTAGGLLPAFWELVVLAAGCGLVAYGAVDRAPGAAWLGVAHLGAFLVAASAGADDTLLWWPAILLALGGGVMAAGLRPRRPLPPEPAGYSVERPLASRADGER
jgi:hypothetical protein